MNVIDGRHILLLTGLLLLAACRFDAPDPTKEDTPTQGRVLILADADCAAMVERELGIFHSFYKKADITVRYLDEADMLRAMMNDSVRCVITTVEPGAEQDAYYRSRNITPPVVPLYHSAIAVVVGPASGLSQLDMGQVARLLGKEGAEQAPDTLQAIFAGKGSGLARLLKDSLGIGQLRAQALADIPAVVEQLERSPRSVGFLPYEAISDLDDPRVQALRERVRILPVAGQGGGPPGLPSQSTIADGSYPLLRTVKAIVTEGKSGLGTGFVSFVANHKGQKIILKLGIVPITVPERIIDIVHN